jgi:XapX domain-containing protein
MKASNTQRLKVALGLVLGLAVGAVCRVLNIPSPAPPVLTGALLVVSMTLGYLAVDKWSAREAKSRHLCAGPTGTTQADT